MSESPRALYCPSCAAKLPADILTSSDPECPVCGTHLTGADQPVVKEEPLAPQKRMSTEDILLERLKQESEQPAPKKLSPVFLVVLVAAIGAIAYIIYTTTKKPEQFAKPKESDNGLTLEQRAMVQRAADSLNAVLKSEPNNVEAHMALANAYYDGMNWAQAAPHYEAYLKAHPDDPAARVDYAYALAQLHPENLNSALDQIDSALKYHPDYLNALYNGGVLAVQMTGANHAEGLQRARAYFARAKSVADTSAPAMAKQIDTLIAEIDRTGLRMAKSPTSKP